MTDPMTPAEALAEALDIVAARKNYDSCTDAVETIELLQERGFTLTPAWRSDMDAAPIDRPILVARHDDAFGWVRGWATWADEGGGIHGWISRGFFDPPGNLGLGNPTHWREFPWDSLPAPPHEAEGEDG